MNRGCERGSYSCAGPNPARFGSSLARARTDNSCGAPGRGRFARRRRSCRSLTLTPQVGGAGGDGPVNSFRCGPSGTARSAVRTSSSGRLLPHVRHVLCPVSCVRRRDVGRGDSTPPQRGGGRGGNKVRRAALRAQVAAPYGRLRPGGFCPTFATSCAPCRTYDVGRTASRQRRAEHRVGLRA